MNPQTVSLIHTALKVLAGILIAHGATKAAALVNTEDVAGLAIGIYGLIASIVVNRKSAIIQKAADSIPTGTVIPSTTAHAPNAQVVTLEQATTFLRKAAAMPDPGPPSSNSASAPQNLDTKPQPQDLPNK